MSYGLHTVAPERPLFWNVLPMNTTRQMEAGSYGTSAMSTISTESVAFGLPVGTVTFLLTDVEMSTSTGNAASDEMAAALARHDEILDNAVAAHGGVCPEEQGEGVGVVAVFSRASDALAAALQAQIEFARETWTTPKPLRVRMAIHTGEARLRGDANEVGLAIIRTARLRDLGHGGQVLVSSASRDLTVDQLGDEISFVDLGQHRLKDLARPEHVYQLEHPELGAKFPLLRSLDAFPNNLPVRLSTFIGREAELSVIAELMESHRLVTIMGAGGAGKTRVALQSAADRFEHYRDGVWWVELAPLTDPDEVAVALAAVVGASLTESRPHAEAIASSLGTKHTLIVLDNCEHLLLASASLTQTLLERCPNLHVLTTSRSPLDVPGEITWRVPPLSVPRPEIAFTIERLSQFESVRLFIDRARNARSAFALSDVNGPAVAEICFRLDGIPLAIELAAARTKSLLPSQILEGLGDALRLLSGGSRLVLPRQQTLEASIRWSCELLDEKAQALLYRLSVFSGSFDLAGAESVCADTELATMEILDLLERLVDQSLVVPLEGARAGRYLILETVRQFGNRELTADALLEGWRKRHAEYYVHVINKFGPLCETREQLAAVAKLTEELDNVRAALNWLRQIGDAATLVTVVWNLGSYWDVGDKLEGVVWCTRVLDMLPIEPSVDRARITALRGECRLSLGEWIASYEDCQTAIAMAEATGDSLALGRGNSTFTSILVYTAPLSQWRTQWTNTVRILTECQDTYALGGTLIWGAVPLLRRGYVREALQILHDVRPQIEEIGTPGLLAMQQTWEAFAATQAGELAKAEQLILLAQSSGALGSQARVNGAETVLLLARSQMGRTQRAWEEYIQRADEAERNGEHVVFNSSMVSAGFEALAKHPEKTREMMDLWARDSSLPFIGRGDGLALGAMATFRLRDLDDAVTRASEILRLAEKHDSVLYIGRAHVLLAAVHVLRNETVDADRCIRTAVDVFWKHGIRYYLCEAFEVYALLAAKCHDGQEAARVLGALSRIRGEMQSPLSFDANLLAEATEIARAALGDQYETVFAADPAHRRTAGCLP